MPSFEDIAMI